MRGTERRETKNRTHLQISTKAQASIHMIFLEPKNKGCIYVQAFRGWSLATAYASSVPEVEAVETPSLEGSGIYD